MGTFVSGLSGLESQMSQAFGARAGGGGGSVSSGGSGGSGGGGGDAGGTKEERMYPRTGGKRLATCFAVTDCLQVMAHTHTCHLV